MTAYRAIVLLTTAAMLVLQVLEWRIGFVVASGIGDLAQKLRLPIRLEALYYLLVLPLLLLTANTLVTRLMVVSAIYHCAGLTLVGSGAVPRRGAAFRPGGGKRLGICAIALLDLGEMVLLVCFCKALLNSIKA
ncbi:MAG: hypothetical protein U0Q18_32980 [Bryobacteraceae bacterium]